MQGASVNRQIAEFVTLGFDQSLSPPALSPLHACLCAMMLAVEVDVTAADQGLLAIMEARQVQEPVKTYLLAGCGMTQSPTSLAISRRPRLNQRSIGHSIAYMGVAEPDKDGGTLGASTFRQEMAIGLVSGSSHFLFPM